MINFMVEIFLPVIFADSAPKRINFNDFSSKFSDKTKPSAKSIGAVIHQFCASGDSNSRQGCDNPEYKVVNSADGTPTETSSRTCRCSLNDFCNKSSSLLYSKLISVLSFSVIFLFFKFSWSSQFSNFLLNHSFIIFLVSVYFAFQN